MNLKNIFVKDNDATLVIPEAFFMEKKYADLSNDAKIMYVLLKNRYDSAIKEMQIDKNGTVYCYFTNGELQEALNMSKRRIVRIKQELARFELLREDHTCGLANKLYIRIVK